MTTPLSTHPSLWADCPLHQGRASDLTLKAMAKANRLQECLLEAMQAEDPHMFLPEAERMAHAILDILHTLRPEPRA